MKMLTTSTERTGKWKEVVFNVLFLKSFWNYQLMACVPAAFFIWLSICFVHFGFWLLTLLES